MTVRSRTYLKSQYENGDVPQGADYSDFIDSFVNLLDTSQQSLAGPLFATEVLASNVSAGTLNATGAVNAASVSASSVNGASITATGTVQASNVSTATLNATGNAVVSGNFNLVGQFTRSVSPLVSATGTTQASATAVTSYLSVVFCENNNSNRAVILPGGHPGREQVIINDSATALAVFPPSGGNINDLGSNNAFSLAASAQAIFLHVTSAQFYTLRGA